MALGGSKPSGSNRRDFKKDFNYQLAVVANVTPASRSMHETSLYKPDHQWKMPEMAGLSLVEQALKGDEMHQFRKYGSVEPCHNKARFHTPTPRSPQHNKFSRPCSRATAASSRPVSRATQQSTPLPEVEQQSRAAAAKGTAVGFSECTEVSALDEDLQSSALGSLPNIGRFNKHTLQKWFREIDRDSSGVISSREFIVAMRKHPAMLALFCGINGIDALKDFESDHGKDEAELMREEVYAIKEVLGEMGNESMEMAWTEFVDFFRRTGLLLEYRTSKYLNLNRTTLCGEMEEKERKELEEQVDKKFTTRRTALTKTLTKMLKADLEELEADNMAEDNEADETQ